MPTHDTTHVADALTAIAQQFKGKPNFEAVISAVATQAQALEDALWQLLTERLLDGNAQGVQLDVIGRIVGILRLGANDADYLARLKAEIRVNISSGTVEDILAVFGVVFAGTIQLEEAYPAAFTLRLRKEAITNETAALFSAFLKAARSAGVRAVLDYETALESSALQCANPVAFLSANSSSGASTVDATGSDLSGFAATGQLTLEPGLSIAEVVTYTSRTSSVFTLSGTTAHNHDKGATIQPHPVPASNGPGLDDTDAPGAGGYLAGVIES